MNFKKPEFWDKSELSIWSIILYPFSLLFLIISLGAKFLKIKKKFPIPIVCVGNIYTGGTGKTPLALEIFKITKSYGKNPAFVKKGYDYLYDEIQMLDKAGKTYSDKNRKEAIKSLISDKHDVAILDDGFQDLSIEKDFSILCFNSRQLIGNGFLIPAGPLRESFNSIKKADCVLINGDRNIEFENKINKINKNIKIFYSKYKIKNIENFKNKEIVAFAGIGNPSNFFHLLKENNINVKKTYSFPDHYNYSENDFSKIIGDKNMKIITTEKDYFRMNDRQKQNCEFVKVDLEIENKSEFVNLIKNKV
jgi:tetraacyldisaccharide 4'-kinase|tara:strand:- start:1054 stop:1974 length:921 start_codon:yes stop_codon:yes gene_type:complete